MTGEEFKALLKMAGPVIGTVASGDGVGRGAFMNAFQQGREIAQQEKQQRDLETQRKQQGAAKFLMDIGTHAQQFDDPVALDQFVRQFAGPAYEAGGFGKASDLVGRFTVPDSKIAAKRVKDIQASLDALKGYDLDELAAGGAHVRLSDGTDIPVSVALDLTNARPIDTSGQAIPQPKKQPAPASSDFARFLERRARSLGKSVNDLTDEEELKAKQDYGRSDDRPTDAAGPAAQYADLVALWKVNHSGKEPDEKTRTELRTQANRVNDKPRELGGMDALYNASDPKAIAGAIMRGERAPDTSGLGRPIGAAVDSILAQNGFNQAQALTDWKATQRHIATLNGSQQLRLNQAINSLPEMLDNVDALAKQWKGGRFALLNRGNLALAKGGAYGPQAASIATQLDAQIADVVADLGNVYMGGNSPTDHALSLAGKSLNGEWDEKVLRDMVALAKKNVVIRRNSIANTGVSGASGSNPYAPQVPSLPPSSETVRMRAPNGQEKDVPADQVEHYKSRGAVVVK